MGTVLGLRMRGEGGRSALLSMPNQSLACKLYSNHIQNAFKPHSNRIQPAPL